MSRGQSLRFLFVCFVLALSLQALHIPAALAASDVQRGTRAPQNGAREASPLQAEQKHISDISSRSMDCTTNPTIDCLDSQLQFPTGVQSSVQNPIAPEFSLLFFTPLDITADNLQIINIWNASLTIVNIFVIVVLSLHGLNIIVSGTIFRYAQAIETIPGVLLALVAANCSLIFIHFFAALNGAFCIDIYVWASRVQNIPDKSLVDALVLVPKDLNFDHISLQNIIDDFGNVMPLIKDVLSAMLLGQIVIRLIFFGVYIVLAPLGLACWALPGKAGQGLTRLWFSGFTTTVMSQSVQVLAIIVVEFSLGPILRIFTTQISGNIIDPGLLNDVVHIAFLWFIIQVTSIFESAPARAIVEIGSAITEAAGAIIGSQFAMQQIIGESFISTVSVATSVGSRSLRRGFSTGGDHTPEYTIGSQGRGTARGASSQGRGTARGASSQGRGTARGASSQGRSTGRDKDGSMMPPTVSAAPTSGSNAFSEPTSRSNRSVTEQTASGGTVVSSVPEAARTGTAKTGTARVNTSKEMNGAGDGTPKPEKPKTSTRTSNVGKSDKLPEKQANFPSSAKERVKAFLDEADNTVWGDSTDE